MMFIARVIFSYLALVHFISLSARDCSQSENVQIVIGKEIQSYEPLIVKLRTSELSKFPYLIWNGEEFEKIYAAAYTSSRNGVLALSYKNQSVVGLLTGISLQEYDEGLGKYGCPLISDQLEEVVDPKSVYHIGELVVVGSNWGEPMNSLFDTMEAYARNAGFAAISFITIIRNEGHPQRPSQYREEENLLLACLGYRKTGKTITYSWPTLQLDGSAPWMENQCDIWLKEFSK